LRRLPSTLGVGLALFAANACTFSEDEPGFPEQNTCQVNADCSTQHCEAGRCVAATVEANVPVTVVVTPKSTPNGLQVQPIVSDSFDLVGGSQNIELRLPVSVAVRVVRENKPLSAQATFTPIDNSNRYTARITKATLLGGTNDDDAPAPDNKAMLLDGMTYRVLIQPTDTGIAPHSLQFTAESGATLDVDYATFASTVKTKSFTLSNVGGLGYYVRAISELTGAPISSTALATGSILTGRAQIKLSFDDPTTPYQLELTPVNKQSYSTGEAGSCGDDAPQPKLSIPSRLFKTDESTVDRWNVELPKLPAAIEYAGTIGLCSSQKAVGDMQVELETRSLYFDSGDSEAVTGSYETATAAAWDAELGTFRFCARVPPGTYTVIVKPGPSINCGVFAERRLLRPDWSGEPDELSLRTPATLTANVLTPDRMPMPKATVDAVAVASGEEARVAEAGAVANIANYNRSGSVATGADGTFSLLVDRGRYDVFIKPPATSNYAWRVLYDVAIATSEAEFATEIMLSEPVAVRGKLQYIGGSTSDQQTLANAEVRAFTLVGGDSSGAEKRSVEIGIGTADASGEVTLLLPPALQHSWNP
jgi:hypothetical protein